MAISFRPNKKQNKLFKESDQSQWQFPLALLFSFCLIFLDRSYTIVPIHQVLNSLVYPLQYAVNLPSRFMNWSHLAWGSKQALLDETRALYAEQLTLKAELQKLSELQNENADLKALLSLSQSSKDKTMAAEVLTLKSAQTRHTLLISKGKKDGVEAGQLVLDTEGVTGQVIEVGLFSSKVLLISDAASAVPVRNQRTGETAILAGTNEPEHLSLIYLPKTASVEPGDVLVTSGLGACYPAGYPVGVVERIDNPLGEAFVRIDVRPLTRYHRNRLVLLVWSPEKKSAKKGAKT